MEIIEKNIDELIPYENNPRKNDEAVEAVANSIREFGFKVPVVVDKDNVVVAGHTRIKAARELGIDQIPCIVADDLTDEQIKAYRLADNKVAELADWDFSLMDEQLAEITEIDMSQFGFDVETDDWFSSRKEFDNEELEDESEEYQEFVEKFEPKRTTDDCYTPTLVYNAVADYVEKEYKIDREHFIRPFYPGGDYQNENYPDGCVVVDNPPFSIYSEILRFYKGKGVRFFLFAPTMVLFNYTDIAVAIAVNVQVTYENGANVATSFMTNLEDETIRARTAPDLYRAVKKANEEVRKEQTKEIPKYQYPDHIVTAAMMGKFSKYGVDYSVKTADSASIAALDEQREKGKAIYGHGYLLSEKAAAEKAAAEKAAAEKAAAEKAAAEKAAAEKAAAEKWTLSARELDIVRQLGEKRV